MANSKKAFEEAVPRVIRLRHIRYLYLASYGDKHGIKCYNEDVIRPKELAKYIGSSLSKSHVSLDGVHVGACWFGSAKHLEMILNSSAKLKWASGYPERADFLRSMTLDMEFIRKLLSQDHEGRVDIRLIAEELREEYGWTCDKLGLAICVRERNKVRNLMKNV